MENGVRSDVVETRLRARIGELEQALAQSEARLREVDHRARNDLQLIWSILLMQMRALPEGPARQAMRRASDRVGAVAAVQKHMPRAEDPPLVDAQTFVRDLVGEIAAGAGRPDVRLDLVLDPIRIAPRQAAPLGLIVEELVHNALGHAFPDRPGRLAVSLHTGSGGAVLTVVDDGVGPSSEAALSGFGTTLVGLLCKQLKGELSLGLAAPGGVRATVRIPEAI